MSKPDSNLLPNEHHKSDPIVLIVIISHLNYPIFFRFISCVDLFCLLVILNFFTLDILLTHSFANVN